MGIDSVLGEVQAVASEFGLSMGVVDLTDNTINLRLYFAADLFIQIYGNALEDKVNLNLVFKERRLLGADPEVGKYHFHPAEKPETHIFTEEKENVRSFVIKSLKVLQEKGLL